MNRALFDIVGPPEGVKNITFSGGSTRGTESVRIANDPHTLRELRQSYAHHMFFFPSIPTMFQQV